MQTINVRVTAEDIKVAALLKLELSGRDVGQFFVGPTPASVALERVTGSKWKTVSGLMLLEESAPYRFGIVPADVTLQLERFLSTGHMEPCDLKFDCDHRRRPVYCEKVLGDLAHVRH